MRQFTRLIVSVALFAMLLLAPPPARPQRCGDSLLIFLRDHEGRVIAPADFESAKVSATYTVDNVANLADAEPDIKELPPKIKSFSVRAVCGMKLAQFRLRYKGEEMTIRVLNVPGDAGHILLEGIGFRSGAYEVDLGGRPLQNVERYEGEGSKAADPADEIEWVIKDHSLRRSAATLSPPKKPVIEIKNDDGGFTHQLFANGNQVLEYEGRSIDVSKH
jgi:hypothetical protein